MRGGTVVVTGVSSFAGCRIAMLLAGRYTRVIGIVSGAPAGYEPLRRMRLAAAQAAGAELRRLNLEDGAAVREWVAGERPEYWVQHAGWAKDYASMDYDMKRGHAVNVEALTPLYEALSANGCKGVIVTGSSAEYGPTEEACLEDDACWPSTPYGLSKLSETIRSRQLADRHGLPTRVARVFIPFGPLDAPGKLLRVAAVALLRGEPVELSPCGQYRDFVHVDDLAEGYDALLEDLARRRQVTFDVFNLCSGRPVRLRELLMEMASHADADPDLLRFGAQPMRPGEPRYSFGSNDKAAQVLGWLPRPLSAAVGSYINGLRGGEGAQL